MNSREVLAEIVAEAAGASFPISGSWGQGREALLVLKDYEAGLA